MAWAWCLTAGGANAAAAQDEARPAGDGAGTDARVVAITEARVLPVSGPPIERGTVLIEDGRIVAVGSGVAVPPGARRIVAGGKVVTPGLLDSFTHLGIVEIDLVEGTADFRTDEDDITAAFDVADGLNPFSTLIPITRVEGVTRAVVAPEPGASLVAGQGVLIDLSGARSESAVHRDPVAMYAWLGEAGAQLTGGARGAAVLRLREVLQDALDYAANREAFESNRRREYAVSRLDLEALVPVVRGQVPLAVLVHKASDILVALRLAREFGLRLVVVGGAEGWLVAHELAEAAVPVVLNPLANIPNLENPGATLENAARLHAAGVSIAFATFESHNSRKLKQAAGNAVANGLPHEAALQAVTLAPARIWGVDEHYGSLEPGKDADVVIWDGDPFELTTRVERVFIRGREMPPETRQQELLREYRRVANPGDAARPSLVAAEEEPETRPAAEGGRDPGPGETPSPSPPPAAGAVQEPAPPAEVPGEGPSPPGEAPAAPVTPETTPGTPAPSPADPKPSPTPPQPPTQGPAPGETPERPT